jgi:hypothetical protein
MIEVESHSMSDTFSCHLFDRRDEVVILVAPMCAAIAIRLAALGSPVVTIYEILPLIRITARSSKLCANEHCVSFVVIN